MKFQISNIVKFQYFFLEALIEQPREFPCMTTEHHAQFCLSSHQLCVRKHVFFLFLFLFLFFVVNTCFGPTTTSSVWSLKDYHSLFLFLLSVNVFLLFTLIRCRQLQNGFGRWKLRRKRREEGETGRWEEGPFGGKGNQLLHIKTFT